MYYSLYFSFIPNNFIYLVYFLCFYFLCYFFSFYFIIIIKWNQKGPVSLKALHKKFMSPKIFHLKFESTTLITTFLTAIFSNHATLMNAIIIWTFLNPSIKPILKNSFEINQNKCFRGWWGCCMKISISKKVWSHMRYLKLKFPSMLRNLGKFVIYPIWFPLHFSCF